tara:strand:+ start:1905 stop:2297 length:393 start_codon:yes stop_codon:yes gene_type:complete
LAAVEARVPLARDPISPEDNAKVASWVAMTAAWHVWGWRPPESLLDCLAAQDVQPDAEFICGATYTAATDDAGDHGVDRFQRMKDLWEEFDSRSWHDTFAAAVQMAILAGSFSDPLARAREAEAEGPHDS